MATDKYCSTFWGSELWDLRGEAAEKIYASWRTNTKHIWNLPRDCKTFFVHSLLEQNQAPPCVSLMTRFHRFFHSLLDSPSPEVRVLVRLSARDLRTNIGKNLRSIHDETGLDPWLFGGQRLKEELLHYNMKPVPEKDKWRIRLLEKYMGIRSQAYYTCDDTLEDIDEMIKSLVKS